MTNLISIRGDIEAAMNHQLAPELNRMGANSVYVVLTSECGWGFNGTLDGLYHNMAAAWLRDEIGGRWKGIGPCWLLDDEAIIEAARGDTRWIVQRLWGVSIHEAAHSVLVPTVMLPSSFIPYVGRKVAEMHRDQFQTTATETPAAIHDISTHGAEFSRVAIHLARRLCRQHGVTVEFRDILPDEPGKPTLSDCWWTLRREIMPLMDRPLSEIASMPMPEKFLNEWDSAAKVAVEQITSAAKAA